MIGATGAPLIVVLDSIEDPHNVGAILRTVDAAGGDGVVRQSRHAARLDGAAAKASAGAVSHVKIAEVVNIARALEELKEAGRLDRRTGGRRAEALRRGGSDAADGDGASARKATGLRRLVRERCDWLVVDPDAGSRSKFERVGGGRHRPVRGGSAARARRLSTPGRSSRECTGQTGGLGLEPVSLDAVQALARLARDVLKFTFCLAGVAQSVEQLICNQQVGGSNPFASSIDGAHRSAR